MSVNKVILVGRLGKDPEVKTLPSGKKVASFSLATDNGPKDKSGNKVTEWHNITCWESRADFAEKWLKKGKEVYLEGRISYEKYTKDGVEKNYTRVTAENFSFVGSAAASSDDESSAPEPAKAAPAKAQTKKAAPVPAPAPEPVAADTDADDLPF